MDYIKRGLGNKSVYPVQVKRNETNKFTTIIVLLLDRYHS